MENLARVRNLNFISPSGLSDFIFTKESFIISQSGTKVTEIKYSNIRMVICVRGGKRYSRRKNPSCNILLPLLIPSNGIALIRIYVPTVVIPRGDPIQVNLDEHELSSEPRYKQFSISKEMYGRKYDVLLRILQAFSGKNLVGTFFTTGGAGRLEDGERCVDCTFHFIMGGVYMDFEQQYLFFIKKTTTISIEIEKIEKIILEKQEDEKKMKMTIIIILEDERRTFYVHDITAQLHCDLERRFEGTGINFEDRTGIIRDQPRSKMTFLKNTRTLPLVANNDKEEEEEEEEGEGEEVSMDNHDENKSDVEDVDFGFFLS